MMKWLARLLVFLALTSCAFAQAWLPLSSVPAPTVWMDFAGNYSTGCSGAFTNCLSVTNDGHGTATTLGGTVVSFSANTLRITDQGLLIEEARTNLFSRSSLFNTASWTIAGGTVTDNATTAPDGTNTAGKLIPNNGELASVGNADILGQFVNLSSATTYSYSFFAKSAEFTSVSVRDNYSGGIINFNLANETTSGSSANVSKISISPFISGWYRCSFVLTNKNGANNFSIRASVTGDGSSGVYIWGFQLEVGSFPTSYIPTTTVAVTRAADVVQALSPLANALAGSVGSIVVKTNLSQQSVAATFLSANGIVLLGKNAGNNGTTAVGATLNTSNTGTWTSANDLGLAWNASGGIINLNATSTTDGVARTPASPIFVGATSGSSAFIDGYIQSIAAFNSKLATPQ